MAYTPQQIAGATGAPLTNVQRAWPGILAALDAYRINSHLVRIGVIATIARETGVFLPIEEEGGWAYYVQELGPAEAAYHGRGYIQLTWSSNYRYYGAKLGMDLVDNPAMALDPGIAAKILCLYFLDRGIPAMCTNQQWGNVQTAVNGGWINWDVFYGVVQRLLAIPEPDGTTPVTTVAVEGPLYSQPRADSPHAIDDKRQPVLMHLGDVVKFTGRVTPHWAELVFANPNPDQAHVRGFFQRAFLHTTYGG